LSDTSPAPGVPSPGDRARTGAASDGAAAAGAAAAGDPATGDPARELERTLREALARHPGELVMLCSFQKEESVLVDELVRLLRDPAESPAASEHTPGGPDRATPVRIVTIDTGVLFPETIATWRAFEERFGIAVEVQDASDPGGGWLGPAHCCSQAKVAALQRALAGAQAWITGLRREQSPTRASTQLVERDRVRGVLKYNPLASWTERDLWRRIHERRLPYHPLHDRGYASIGCAPCTQPGSGRDGRWAGTAKTECGLHVPPGDPTTLGSAAGVGG
jgi:phosphoadenosine phosphosulfate reductase